MVQSQPLGRGRWGLSDVRRWFWPLLLISICPIGVILLRELVPVQTSALWELGDPYHYLTFRGWMVLSLCWMMLVALAPLVWIYYRRHRHKEDVLWVFPPVLQRAVIVTGYGVLAAVLVMSVGVLCAPALVESTTLRWILMGVPLAIVLAFTQWLAFQYRRVRAEPHRCCWTCLYDISHIHPNSDACPECGFPVSESISRWKVCPEAFRPKWVTEDEGQEKLPFERNVDKPRG